MRKITSLLMLLCMFVGTAWGEVTKFYKPGERLSALVAGSKVMFYNTTFDGTQDRTGFLVDNGSAFGLDKSKPADSPIFSEKVGVWTVESVEVIETGYSVTIKGTNGYVGIGGATNNAESQVLLVHEWTKVDANKRAGADSENALGEKVANVDISAEDKVWLITNADQSTAWNGNINSFSTWSTGHPYAIYSIVEASEGDLDAVLATAKANAVYELNAMKTLSEIFTTVGSTIDQVENVAIVNSDLESALNTINVLIASVKAEADGKNVKLSNKSADGRGGKFLGYDAGNNRAAAIADGGDAAIWTIKANADGTFKMYNFASNLYLGLPDGAGPDNAKYTPMHQNAADAPSYTFIPTAENVLALTTGNRMVHIANHSNYKVMNYWSTTDAASLWEVTVVDPIVISREVYDAALAAKVSLPYAIQQAYGLVTDASCYYSNWKSDAEGSYDALLDNLSDTYFHSAYTDEAKAEEAETHYIQANFGTGASVGEFYIYMAPRNGNNRPVNITVSGSNDGETFTKIEDITTTLASSDTYLSEKLGVAETKYQYIRLTVNSTNTSTKFFTLSELYFFPAEGDTEDLVDAYHDFTSSSITSSEIVSAASTLIDAGAVLALSNIKKEIKAELDANAGNHAATPALGQYTTAGYNALKAAYEAADATQESLEKAIEDFRYAKNLPVFTIDGVVSYASGKSIYDGETQNAKGNTHYFKTTNLYDKTMWWALDLNTTTVGVAEEVGIYNVGTHKNFWNSSTIKITETNENDGAGITDDGIFLFYTTGNNTPIHYQNDGSLITRWASYDAASGSAHKFTYVANTYELANLTDEKIQALAALKAAYDAKAYYKNAVVGDGLGQYKGNKDAIVAELAKAEAVYMKTISQQAAMTVEEINAIAKSITDVAGLTLNMPETGFYRVKSLNGNDANKAGKYWQIGVGESGYTAMEAGTDLAKSIVYIKSNGETYNIVNYVSGLYLNKYSELKPAGTAAESWTIVENSAVAGAYALYAGIDDFCLSDWTGSITYGQKDANAAWTFEPVDVLPVAVTSAGYATLYAPVALTLADGVEAYYVPAKSASSATMTQVKSVVPANTAVLLKAEEGSYNLTIAAEAQAIEGNLLAGTVGSELVESEAFVLGNKEKGVGFYRAELNQKEKTAFVNNGFRAYLPAAAAGARFLSFDFGTETAIDELKGENGNVKTVIYDLSGRRVQKAQKGLYIVNGVKVIK